MSTEEENWMEAMFQIYLDAQNSARISPLNSSAVAFMKEAYTAGYRMAYAQHEAKLFPKHRKKSV